MSENNANNGIMPNANERVRIMLDATPLCCTFWDEDCHVLDCNQAAMDMFGLSSRSEYLNRFFEFSPEVQPDGKPSAESAVENVRKAFAQGWFRFEWMHSKLDGELIPTEVTLVSVHFGDSSFVAGYMKDQRNADDTLAKTRKEDESVRLMLDTAPLGCCILDHNLQAVECNQEAVSLFGLASKSEFISKFSELSPKLQPGGQLSSERMAEKIRSALHRGRLRFEWMHQKPDGELVPSEVTLVRVKRDSGYCLLCYIRDLRELTETVSMLHQLEVLAYTDSLTGAFNRRYFMEIAGGLFNKKGSDYPELSIIMFDLDRFKRVNDTYGHAAGDEVLKTITSRVQSVLRPTEFLVRYGGEEFLIFIGDSDLKLAEKLAWRVKEEVSKTKTMYMDQEITITVSLGVAGRTDGDMTLDELIEHADQALYQAKMNGRNTVVVYDEKIVLKS